MKKNEKFSKAPNSTTICDEILKTAVKKKSSSTTNSPSGNQENTDPYFNSEDSEIEDYETNIKEERENIKIQEALVDSSDNTEVFTDLTKEEEIILTSPEKTNENLKSVSTELKQEERITPTSLEERNARLEREIASLENELKKTYGNNVLTSLQSHTSTEAIEDTEFEKKLMKIVGDNYWRKKSKGPPSVTVKRDYKERLQHIKHKREERRKEEEVKGKGQISGAEPNKEATKTTESVERKEDNCKTEDVSFVNTSDIRVPNDFDDENVIEDNSVKMASLEKLLASERQKRKRDIERVNNDMLALRHCFDEKIRKTEEYIHTILQQNVSLKKELKFVLQRMEDLSLATEHILEIQELSHSMKSTTAVCEEPQTEVIVKKSTPHKSKTQRKSTEKKVKQTPNEKTIETPVSQQDIGVKLLNDGEILLSIGNSNITIEDYLKTL
ncbi:hypothetical protein ABK040_002429 [Willaertia magna]